MILLVVIYCKITQGVLEWIVVGKVTDYGQNVTLFCNVSHCCPDDAGWDRWTPVQQTLFIDVKAGGGGKKYDGKVMRDGYTLIIQNLTKDDLNVSYSCLYGVTLGERKFLQEEDVFSYTINKQNNVPIGSSSLSAGNITGITIGVIFVLGTVVGFLIYYKIRTKAPKTRNLDQIKNITISVAHENNSFAVSKLKSSSFKCETHLPMLKTSDSNVEQDVIDNKPVSSSKTLNEGETHLPMLETSDSNVEQDVIDNKPVSSSKTLNEGKTDSPTLQSSCLVSSVSKDDRPEVICNSPGIYNADPKKQCRVLCILNEKVKIKLSTALSLTWTLKSPLFKWKLLQFWKMKTKCEFTSIRALFVIVVSSGDKSGIYGTEGEKIQHDEITTKFEQVAGLREKPKIFILDYFDIESDIPDQRKPRQISEMMPKFQTKMEISKCKVPTEDFTTDTHHLNRTKEGVKMVVNKSCYETVPNEDLDTYRCIATTLGRSDEIVKGSWVLGALLSVICEAGHYTTFKEMMKVVEIMVTEAIIPEGRPEPKIEIKDCLTKDFYLLPLSS
ncbi:unnamed protein product [Mytilus edulis]|uniref:Caspase family p10 domain-containing protein n=1 Tax=Mytilus edulis TaxID=6550 RepID=A0A8S3SVJ3_MYTED|nr:unnamed protein product [Mytilus edulis]